jgi:hypothetical protein
VVSPKILIRSLKLHKKVSIRQSEHGLKATEGVSGQGDTIRL